MDCSGWWTIYVLSCPPISLAHYLPCRYGPITNDSGVGYFPDSGKTGPMPWLLPAGQGLPFMVANLVGVLM